jgi:hypothetical protein
MGGFEWALTHRRPETVSRCTCSGRITTRSSDWRASKLSVLHPRMGKYDPRTYIICDCIPYMYFPVPIIVWGLCLSGSIPPSVTRILDPDSKPLLPRSPVLRLFLLHTAPVHVSQVNSTLLVDPEGIMHHVNLHCSIIPFHCHTCTEFVPD